MATAPTSNPRPEPQLSANDRFFRYFQQQVTDLQAQFTRLETQATTGGERADAVDHCLASIARLSNEVKDASSYLPAYDQRTYGDAIKALSSKLQDVRASFAPRQKFAFKKGPAFTARKNESAISLSDAAELAHERRMDASSNESSFATTPAELMSPAGEPEDDDATAASTQSYSTTQLKAGRQPSFSQSKSVNLSHHDGVHIILPAAAGQATASGTLALITRCVVDMGSPTRAVRPFATLTLKHIRDSLVVCGHVSGAAHLTKISNSIVVVASRQFRMHESRNVDVYLRCGSRPIIEDCTGIRFAPLPETYAAEGEEGREGENMWDQVDDFKWLRSEPSPNWRAMKAEERLEERVWREVVPGGPGKGVEDVLREVGLQRAK